MLNCEQCYHRRKRSKCLMDVEFHRIAQHQHLSFDTSILSFETPNSMIASASSDKKNSQRPKEIPTLLRAKQCVVSTC